MVSSFIGFLGMLLIVQPAYAELNYYYLSPILFAFFFRCGYKCKALSKTEPNYRMLFTLLFMYNHRISNISLWLGNANSKDLLLFVVMGLCGSVANLLLTQSYRLAEASLVTPINI